ncbi:MAG TPA: hypothetical protein VK788_10835 [Terriglobales bacterium]|nr:hypothetical protein [Terriglobales bacterium]
MDIIFEQRLYCPDWRSLNDAVEGTPVFSCRREEVKRYSRYADQVMKEMDRIRVCSLSLTFDSHLLWAHYASGWDGLAIEVELPQKDGAIREVEYGGFYYCISPSAGTAKESARRVLTSRHPDWSYEKEVRVFADSEWYQLQSPVKRVIVGHRMNASMRETLRILCAEKGIPLRKTGVGDEGIDADMVYPLKSGRDEVVPKIRG